MKNKFIAGNWKMNKSVAETKEFFNEFLPLVSASHNTIALCVPYTDIAVAAEAVKGSNVHIGAQNVHEEQKGAYTGEITAKMLADVGAEYVIIGHSERRMYYNESNKAISLKIQAALACNLKPIVCIGETIEQRNGNLTEQVLCSQIKEGFEGVTAEQMSNITVAYEPIWAIGTGVTATTEQAEQTIAYVRSVFTELYGAEVAEGIYIQYGGSMNDRNAAELLSQKDIDGGLVGGASLVPQKFAAIVLAK